MSLVHVYPDHDMRRHVISGGRCWCEPTVKDCGKDADGDPARVYIHTDQDERRGLPPREGR